MKYEWVCFLVNVCVCHSKCWFKETHYWFFVGGQYIGWQTKPENSHSFLCHLNFISWMPAIKRHCSFKYYSLLMFNVSGITLFFWKRRLDMQTINHPNVYFIQHLLIMVSDKIYEPPIIWWMYTSFNSHSLMAFILFSFRQGVSSRFIRMYFYWIVIY